VRKLCQQLYSTPATASLPLTAIYDPSRSQGKMVRSSACSLLMVHIQVLIAALRSTTCSPCSLCSDLRSGLNKGHPTTAIARTAKPSHRKGVQSTKTKFVRSVIREVAGFSPYERRVLELLRNSKVLTVIRRGNFG